MMIVRHSLTRRDAVLVLLGASCMHIFTFLFRSQLAPPEILIDTGVVRDHLLDVPPVGVHVTHIRTKTIVHATTVIATAHSQPTADTHVAEAEVVDVARDIPETTIVAHAPGWTLFENLYMYNDTLVFVSDTPSDFPDMRLMTSTPMTAENNPENIAAREPTRYSMTSLTPTEARRRWGAGPSEGGENRIFSVTGNTILVNEPSQFLRHYYHLVAELLFGVQAFWHGALSGALDSDPASATHRAPPPPIDRIIFARSDADGWRDDPGFNAYVVRAAFPDVTIEEEEDWIDRVIVTSDGDRAWHFRGFCSRTEVPRSAVRSVG
ncbi:unnamed protein product [Mycena citricolor]|uniref:Uncharacterized protein n=1 Tax=Mycena citricolor TaxID=2018698 RepID=A0AAD2HXR6_9AGAR|nr:unnamed protein product [Mycena citricolor]